MTQANATIKRYDFTIEEVTRLFQMQDELNTYIHPEWKTQGFNWGLAIVDECMEIHGHLGWKWWKKDYQVGLTEGNKKQVQLEVIDILHFVLSDYLDNADSTDNAVEEVNDIALEWQIGGLLKGLMGYAVNGANALDIWASLAHSVGLAKQEILETYIQKYVLNKFRQDHGYKTGEYVKEWETFDSEGTQVTWEDNQALENIVAWLKLTNRSVVDENALYAELKLKYTHRINQ